MSPELRELLVQVITSWQVIAATIAIVIYFSLVGRVTRKSKRKKTLPIIKAAKGAKKKKAPAAAPEPSDSDDLGVVIEEE